MFTRVYQWLDYSCLIYIRDKIMGRLRIEHPTSQESSHALYSLLGGVGENITGLGVCWVVLGVGVR